MSCYVAPYAWAISGPNLVCDIIYTPTMITGGKLETGGILEPLQLQLFRSHLMSRYGFLTANIS